MVVQGQNNILVFYQMKLCDYILILKCYSLVLLVIGRTERHA